MTPHATLMVRATDVDETIRHAFQELSKRLHPDKNNGVRSPEWDVVAQAYSTIKTEDRRMAWSKAMAKKAGRCKPCQGYGTVGSRLLGGKVRLCATCDGAGVVK
jgi:DnaJ-class molecular chaperone